MSEQDRTRMSLWNSIVSVPHRDYAKLVPVFCSAMETDPDFASRAMVELRFRSKIRDVVDAGIITLLQADPQFPEFREAGRCLLLGSHFYNIAGEYSTLQGLEPYRILRIDRYIRGSAHKSPRLMKSIANTWLHTLTLKRFEGIVMQPNGRKGLKAMYKAYHIDPGDYVQRLLFTNDPPKFSILWLVKQIVALESVTDKARMIMEHHLPYEVASSLMPKTVEAGIALVDIMTPTQALNSRSWVEKLGILEIPEVKAVYLAKVGQATASVASAEFRKSAQGADTEVQEAISQAKERAVQTSDRIDRDTLLLVDKSGSMESAITFAQHTASRIAPLCDGAFVVIAFDTSGRVITSRDNSLAGWQSAFRMIRAGGGTSVGAGLSTALSAGFMPEQVVIITDEDENQRPFYADVLQQYMNQTGLMVNTYVISLPMDYFGDSRNDMHHRGLSNSLSAAQLPCERFEIDSSDYYVLDQISQLLTGDKGTTLVDLILQRQLPYRFGR